MNISVLNTAVAVPATEVQQLSTAVQELPDTSPLRELVSELLDAVARGAGISLVEQEKELSPNDVASLLQVSRPHVMKMIREGVLIAHPVGKHHRVRYSDFIDFAERRELASKHVAEIIAHANTPAPVPLTEEEMEDLRQL
ncbi:helix-turn-helix domain-containing protein [Microbacterium sp. NPDC091382]|uniref:helix-turn-helix domain-containing protein n=1 Tax=Microbacterium sp. NPDC091382 TaxID=3364210 RepID=UPI0037F54303